MNNNNVTVIGDTHGTLHWKNIVTKTKPFTKSYIFVGDYCDSYFLEPPKIIENLKELIHFARYTPNVHLCLGNHEYHYLNLTAQRYSGYRKDYAGAYYEVLDDAIDLFKIAYTLKDTKNKLQDIIVSHAGITKSWLYNCAINSVDSINAAFKRTPEHFDFQVYVLRCNTSKRYARSNYGDDIFQGPLWVRPNSLMRNKITGTKQIIGHTQVPEVTYYGKQIINVNTDKDNGYITLPERIVC